MYVLLPIRPMSNKKEKSPCPVLNCVSLGNRATTNNEQSLIFFIFYNSKFDIS